MTTTTSNFTALVNIINASKNICEYAIANAAFACLLDEVLDRDDIKIQYESQDNYNNAKKVEGVINDEFQFFILDTWEYSGEPHTYTSDTYYDLITISDGLRDVCIPVPLLKPNVAKACFEDAKERNKFINKREHNRSHTPALPKQREYLLDQLEKICPNWSDLTNKYLANKIEKEEIPFDYLLCNMHGYEEGLAKDVVSQSNIYRVDNDHDGHCTYGMHGAWYADNSPGHSGDIQIIPILVGL